MDDLLLRWAIGEQDTSKLSEYEEAEYEDMLWLAKLSIVSFQKWFPEADFMLFYNGFRFDDFVEKFEKIPLDFFKPISYVDQNKNFLNRYHFYPIGVFFKWVPMRQDINKHEISIDTDIICLNKPDNWYEWLEDGSEIIIAPERFKDILVNTCGDFHKHPMLKNKKPLNCGVVGHRKEQDFSDRFFEVTKEIKFGDTHNSLFITEQGAINVWARSLQKEGINLYILDFDRNVWLRDLVYYLRQKQKVETVHAVSWHKKIIKELKVCFQKKVFDDTYDDSKFLKDIVSFSSFFTGTAKKVIKRQLG